MIGIPVKNHDEAIGLADWATTQMKAQQDKELAGGQVGTANYSRDPKQIPTPNLQDLQQNLPPHEQFVFVGGRWGR